MKTRREPQMKQSYLVQRLLPPMRVGMPFSFGGGLVNGGLSAEAVNLLGSICSFDYMGSAEFEWGAVPKALQRMADNSKSLRAFSFPVDLASVPLAPWTKDRTPRVGTAAVYVICPAEWRGEVEARIRLWAAERYPRLLELTKLPDSLLDDEPDSFSPKGWLELDNGFAFFTDRTMWEQTARLFGITPQS